MATVLLPPPGYVGPGRWAERCCRPGPTTLVSLGTAPRTMDVAGAGRSGAVQVDQDFALAHSKDDGFVRFGAGIPLTVHHALGDAYEVARATLDALGTARAELQSQAPSVWNT
jgi:hypothetical protein